MDVGVLIRTPWVRAGVTATLAVVVALGGVPEGAVRADGEWSIRVPVLLYHHVADPRPGAPGPDRRVSPSRFRAQLRALRDDGWTTMTAGQLAMALWEGTPIGPKRFVITFDDGARDGWTNAAPILAELGMRATFCVVPGWAGRRGRLDPEHMRRLGSAGHEIADHSLGHRDLRDLGARRLRRQVFGAQRLIRRYTGREARTFCYPMGGHDAAARRVVAASGHMIAFTATGGDIQSAARAMRSPRIHVSGTDTPRELVARIGRS